jgi:hypothetical protein
MVRMHTVNFSLDVPESSDACARAAATGHHGAAPTGPRGATPRASTTYEHRAAASHIE